MEIICKSCGKTHRNPVQSSIDLECDFCGTIIAAETYEQILHEESKHNAAPVKEPKSFSVGTLVYSKAGLAWLFTWLLWGDFCFTMIETVVPSIVPLRLRELQAPNWIIGLVLITLPSILNVALNPIISTASDRHRGKFGRRIPFMLFTVPLVAMALCFMAFSTELGALLHPLLGGVTGLSAAAVTIGVIAIAMGLFKFSDMFVNTVFWYFFNDVVPQSVMARFLSLFRIVGASAGVIYNYFIFQYALTHLRFIFLTVAVLYLVGFTLMCLLVKEGQYPPPDKLSKKRTDIPQIVKTYLKECLQHRIYHYFFMHNMFWSLSASCNIFIVFLNLSLGLTMQQIGSIAAAVGIAYMALAYPAGMLADRFHPLRVMIFIKIGLVAIAPLNLIWLFTSFSPTVNYGIVIAIQVVQLPLMLIYFAVGLPMHMRILPKDRFGQFCSFNAICSAGLGALGGVLAGGYIDLMKRAFPEDTWGKEFYYRMVPVWGLPFLLLGLFFLFKLYRAWKELGGDEHYTPPGSNPEFTDVPVKNNAGHH
jgi:maltose/moltooligosaccharide transporter